MVAYHTASQHPGEDENTPSPSPTVGRGKQKSVIARSGATWQSHPFHLSSSVIPECPPFRHSRMSLSGIHALSVTLGP